MAGTLKQAGVFIGTSGWSYRHWKGIFYPAEVKPAEYLEYYLTRFDCVELNSSFYHLPKSKTVEGWLGRTPESFRFCVKLSRIITHYKRLGDCEEALGNFFSVFEALKPRLGPVLIQLPPGLSYDPSLITDFLDVLKGYESGLRFAMEIRNKSWINDHFLDCLAQHGIAFVIADSGKRFPSYEAVTTNFVYLRLHGPDSLYSSDYTGTDLRQYAGKILNWLGAGHEVWVFFNNDYHGFAVKNASQLSELVHSSE